MSRILRARELYMKYERHLSSASLIGGFLFDIFVLERIDRPGENLWIIAHLLAAVLGIVLLNSYFKNGPKDREPLQLYYWVVILVQFAFGGLLSTFLVFYFRSATLITSWPFLLVLLAAFSANELLKEHYSRLTFQVSYFFLCVLSFMIYYVPIVFGQMGKEVFVASGFASIIIVVFLLLGLSFLSEEEVKKSRRGILASIAGIFLIVNALYFLNIIPPIPLSLKDSGVYHFVTRNREGDYLVTGEEENYLRIYERFHYTVGSPVYVYSAVFSPTDLSADLLHEWQYYDEDEGIWITMSTVDIPIRGGRENGYRAYSLLYNIKPGFWRVNVENEQGQLVGRIRFEVLEGAGEDFSTVTEIKK